jgi:SNF2 family DNA or RNA helicase
MRAYIQGNKPHSHVILSFDYDPKVVYFVKSLPDRKFIPANKKWKVGMRTFFDHYNRFEKIGFIISDGIKELYEEDKKLKIDLKALLSADDAEFDTKLPLLHYQRVGAKFLATAGSAVLGDDVGLGKTIQTIAVMEANKVEELPSVIFCPAILKYQWEAEIKKFVPDANIQVIDGNAFQRAGQWKNAKTYFIANYELLLRDFEYLISRNWNYIIADEATRISSASAKTTKAIKKLEAKHRIALTGTLISNRAEEAWSVVDFVAPGELGRYWDFLTRYCLKNMWGGIQGYQNLDELNRRLKRYMIRRTKEEVLTELPDKIISDVPIELLPEEKELYKQLKKELLFDIKPELLDKVENPVLIQNTLVKMTRLRQLCDSMELLGQGTSSSKLEALKTILESVKDKKVIIFTEFSKMADILQREIPGSLKITGDVSNDMRQEILKSFNTMYTRNILIMSSAGKFGLNIQAASVVIHYDQPWSLASVIQREGRAHRMGQKENVLIYNLLCRGTMDMYIRTGLRKKQQLSDRILMSDIEEMLEYGEE